VTGPAAPADARAVLARNVTALYIAQAAGWIVPLATVPYVARVLRPEGWAPVLVAQAVGAWIVLMVEYGFDLTGSRDGARARRDPTALAGVVQRVLSAQLMLAPFALCALVAAFTWSPVLAGQPALLASAAVYAVLRGMNPLWFFQATERVVVAASIDAGARSLAGLGVFLVVQNPSDGWRVVALQAVFSGVSLAALFTLMRRSTSVPAPSLAAGRAAIRDAWPVFGARVVSGVYIHANTLILAALASPVVVAMFGAAERLIRAAINLLQPLTQVFVPRVSYVRAADPAAADAIVRRNLVRVGAFGVVLAAGAIVGAPLLVRALLGPGYEDAIPILRMLAALIPLTAVNTVLSFHWALPAGFERRIVAVVCMAAVTSLAVAWLLVPGLAAAGMSAAVVSAEIVVMTALGTLYLRTRS
jgi:PST family polysaccharide transporter